jgi:hypothetical protein
LSGDVTPLFVRKPEYVPGMLMKAGGRFYWNED